METRRFIEPVDVLFLRGNRLFGEAEGGGQALMPPWPSVFAGALRTAMLDAAGVDPVAFGRGGARLPAGLAEVLGTPSEPGSFTLFEVTLARCTAAGVEPVYPAPADLAGFPDASGGITLHRRVPVPPPPGIATATPLPRLPVLPGAPRGKPVSGLWLSERGWTRYLRGEPPEATDCVRQGDLWQTEPRLGIALDGTTRRAAEGQLYTTEAVRLAPNPPTGFRVAVRGIEPGQLPEHGVLRLGGDGRGARMQPATAGADPGPDWAAIGASGRFRVVLTSPGLFPHGWHPPGAMADGCVELNGVRARLVAAAVPRGQTVSGWDLAKRGPQGAPKAAQRAAPTGSVYWFEGLDGDLETLRKLPEVGLFPGTYENLSPARRAEGFNRCVIANP